MNMTGNQTVAKVFEKKLDFVTKYGRLPNTVYLGKKQCEAVDEFFTEHFLKVNGEIKTIYSLDLVEVAEEDHLSVGLSI